MGAPASLPLSPLQRQQQYQPQQTSPGPSAIASGSPSVLLLGDLGYPSGASVVPECYWWLLVQLWLCCTVGDCLYGLAGILTQHVFAAPIPPPTSLGYELVDVTH